MSDFFDFKISHIPKYDVNTGSQLLVDAVQPYTINRIFVNTAQLDEAALAATAVSSYVPVVLYLTDTAYPNVELRAARIFLPRLFQPTTISSLEGFSVGRSSKLYVRLDSSNRKLDNTFIAAFTVFYQEYK